MFPVIKKLGTLEGQRYPLYNKKCINPFGNVCYFGQDISYIPNDWQMCIDVGDNEHFYVDNVSEEQANDNQFIQKMIDYYFANGRPKVIYYTNDMD